MPISFRIFHSLLWSTQSKAMPKFSGTLLLFRWSSGYWQFDLWFLGLFQSQLEHLEIHGSCTDEAWLGEFWDYYCIGTWTVRSTNPGKLDVVKQKRTRLNINISGISELKCKGMAEFNSDDHFIYYCGKEPLRRKGVALTVNKSLKYSTWVQHQKRQNHLGSFSR